MIKLIKKIKNFFFSSRLKIKDETNVEENPETKHKMDFCLFNGLHFYPGYEESISLVRKVLKDYKHSDHKRGCLDTVLFMYNLKVKELEEYLDSYRRKYFENLKQLMDQLTDKEDKRTIKKEATKHLGIKPFQFKNSACRLLSGWDREELIFLFEGPYILDVSIADRKRIVGLLGGVDQFQYNFRFYFARDRGPGSVNYSPPEDYYRKRFMTLYKTGLALKGEKIPSDALINFIVKKTKFNELKKY